MRISRNSLWRNALMLIGLSLGLVVGCGGPKSATGFRLPDGDVERGRQVFIDLRCGGCHTIKDSDLPYIGDDERPVELGGTTARVRTYGELVTSVINPSHRIAPGFPDEAMPLSDESPMLYAALNETMTVQQLIDVVAFLQVQYEVVPPEVDLYPTF